MKRPIVVVIMTIILVAIQSSVAYDQILTIFSSKPDMLLIFVAFLGFRYGFFEGIIYGFLIGFAQDVVSGGILGINSLVFLNIGLAMGYLSNKIYSKSLSTGIVLISIALVVKTIFFLFASMIYSDLDSVFYVFRTELLVGLPLNILIASPMFILFEKIAPIILDSRKSKVDQQSLNAHNEE